MRIRRKQHSARTTDYGKLNLFHLNSVMLRLHSSGIWNMYSRNIIGKLDDIIVMGRTYDAHLKDLGKVLRPITMAGLKLSGKKYALFQQEVKYLRQLVTADVISADEGKIRAVRN